MENYREDEEADPTYGKAYYVGRVSHNSHHRTTTPAQIRRAYNSVQDLVTLPKMEIFYDYEGIYR